MQMSRFEIDIKKAILVTCGIVTTFAVWAYFGRPVTLKAPGDEPPRSTFWGHLPWLRSKGAIGSNGYAQLIIDYFQRQNQKSFWIRLPSKVPMLNTVNPEVTQEVFSCPYKWIKPNENIQVLKDLLGDGIFNANGSKWRIQRKQASYLFSEKNLKEVMLPVMEKGTWKIVNKFASLSADEPFEVQNAFHDLFMDTFSEIAFGWDSNTFDTDSKFGYNYDKIFPLLVIRSVNPFWKIQRWLKTGYEKEIADRIKTHKEIIRNVVFSAIDKKKEYSTGQVKNLMDRLLEISAKGNPLAVETLVDFVTNFIVAGRDTTALTMTWALYNLISFPSTRQKLLDAIKRARTAHPRDLWSQLKDMVYVDAWIWESLRFYPPVPTVLKMSTASTVLKDGSVVPKNSKVVIRVQASSWNPNIWENARAFSPERHLKEGKLNIKSPEEFPIFNGGKRQCIGKKMAIINAKLMLSELVTRFEFTLCKDKPAPDQTWTITSKSSTGMWLKVKSTPAI